MKILDPKNNRGIALLIVLLVTALLIALVFEFAYATRISLNSAVNYRDSERAYFLAMTGINAYKSHGQNLRDLIPAGEWQPVPLPGDNDTIINVKWEDESGKIRINDVKSADGVTLDIARRLFEKVKGMDAAILDRMTDQQQSDISHLVLLSDLHQYMSDEDFSKVADNLTTAPVSTNNPTININTAPRDVLEALDIQPYDADAIIKDRKAKPYVASDLSSSGRLARLGSIVVKGRPIFSFLTVNSAGYYKVYTSASVGGYTKIIQAIMKDSSVTYWKAL